MELKPLPKDGRCTECGEDGLTLCRDVTQYHTLTIDDGDWLAGHVHHQEEIWSSEGVRVFCPACGTYFEPPTSIEWI